MRTFIIIFLIIFSLPTFSQWEKTEWRCDAYVSGIRAFGDVLYLNDIDSAHISRDNKKMPNIYQK